MGSEFKRLRRFNGLWTTIRALTFAVSAFMLLEGIFLLLGKMQILQLGLLGAVISLAAAAAVGSCTKPPKVCISCMCTVEILLPIPMRKS